MAKPRIFLGSSGKQAKLLQALTRGLEDVADVEPLTTTFTRPNGAHANRSDIVRLSATNCRYIGYEKTGSTWRPRHTRTFACCLTPAPTPAWAPRGHRGGAAVRSRSAPDRRRGRLCPDGRSSDRAWWRGGGTQRRQ